MAVVKVRPRLMLHQDIAAVTSPEVGLVPMPAARCLLRHVTAMADTHTTNHPVGSPTAAGAGVVVEVLAAAVSVTGAHHLRNTFSLHVQVVRRVPSATAIGVSTVATAAALLALLRRCLRLHVKSRTDAEQSTVGAEANLPSETPPAKAEAGVPPGQRRPGAAMARVAAAAARAVAAEPEAAAEPEVAAAAAAAARIDTETAMHHVFLAIVRRAQFLTTAAAAAAMEATAIDRVHTVAEASVTTDVVDVNGGIQAKGVFGGCWAAWLHSFCDGSPQQSVFELSLMHKLWACRLGKCVTL